MANLLLAFDGTWNRPDINPKDGDGSTNVWRMVRALAPKSQCGTVQQRLYCEGVGTNRFDRIRGGVFGQGLSDHILSGYRFLIEHYQPGDKIFLIGFSRGAYTARSLAGLIDRLGLLPTHEDVEQAFELYRSQNSQQQSAFKARHARSIEIEAVAVWDTVGALGIPGDLFDTLNTERYQFHDTSLGDSIRHAYHALAVDEHRPEFRPTLWQRPPGSTARLAQRWFPGAHADVGGGYHQGNLADLSYQWIEHCLASHGLSFVTAGDHQIDNADSDRYPISLPHDSFAEFARGWYAQIEERYLRPLGAVPNGFESIDESVFRLMTMGAYRPDNPLGPFLNPDQYARLQQRYLASEYHQSHTAANR